MMGEFSGVLRIGDSLYCKGCRLTFKEQRDLDIHVITCTRPAKGTAFVMTADLRGGLPAEKRAEPIPRNEKLALPDSQNNPNTHNADEGGNTEMPHSCHLCNRSFGNARGLKQHLVSCKKKNANRRQQRQTPELQPPEALATPEIPPHNPPQNPVGATEQADRRPQNLVWGNKNSEDMIQIVNSIYEEVVFWRKTLFKLPSGAAGKSFVKETTKLICIWNEAKQPLNDIALKMVMIMPVLLLQKTTSKSTSKQHSEYLLKRLVRWTEGNFDDLMKEGRAIQQRLKEQSGKYDTIEHIAKTFAKLMAQSKVHAALRLLDKAASLGVAPLTDETMKALAELHPSAEAANDITLLQGETPYFDPVLFSNINEQSIAKAASRTRGSAGPSGLDAEGWRRILISKNYGTLGKDLRTAIVRVMNSDSELLKKRRISRK